MGKDELLVKMKDSVSKLKRLDKKRDKLLEEIETLRIELSFYKEPPIAVGQVWKDKEGCLYSVTFLEEKIWHIIDEGGISYRKYGGHPVDKGLEFVVQYNDFVSAIKYMEENKEMMK